MRRAPPGAAPAGRSPRPGPHRWAALALLLAATSCGKVPIHNVGAAFSLADAAWFAEEETLFVFYDVSAEQGLGEPSVIEITYATDTERVDWTPVSALPTVHAHLPVDCGANALCGSTSLHLPEEPREVGIRLRYHRDGALSLDADTVFNVVGPGAPHTHRSLLVYGVFDETNQRVQWRARHRFPTLRNEQAQAYGLRRQFRVEAQAYGTADLASAGNPYGYGVDCPASFAASGLDAVETDARAAFNPADLPQAASSASTVCAEATVEDALGAFTTGAVARKNPEVRPAFPVLRSPIHEASRIPFFLAPCDGAISADHEQMQRQRLLMGGEPAFCTDGWEDGGAVDEAAVDALVVALRDAVEAERPAGDDMVLVIGLHRDDEVVAEAVEEALSEVLPGERERSTPRLVGAFVFDSEIHGLERAELKPVTLWCPAPLPDGTELPDASGVACAIAPDNLDLELGPFSFGTLPILPSRDQYLDFIDTYSEAQAGEVTRLRFLAPEFAATSDHTAIGDYGVATFLNDEVISADEDDAFSYCVPDEYQLFVFRSELLQSEDFAAVLERECAAGNLPDAFCALAGLGILPIEWLPQWHELAGERTYELGISWDFPFLLRMEYELVAAGSVTAFGFSVPFGVAGNGESYLGGAMWTAEEFPLEDILTQCRRFCDHPTFDSAGVYHVAEPFRHTYANTCYLPRYPRPGDGGFPLDP